VINLAIGRAVACALLLAALVVAVGWFVHHEREIGRAEVQAKWDAERAALQAKVREQQDRNLELQRAAEKRYTVVAEVRDRFITKIVTEVRDATVNLAACRLSPDAVRLLDRAGRCASQDRPASCGAGLGVQSTR
jgi:hypothetical protein